MGQVPARAAVPGEPMKFAVYWTHKTGFPPVLIFGHANFFRGAAGGVKLPSACCSRI